MVISRIKSWVFGIWISSKVLTVLSLLSVKSDKNQVVLILCMISGFCASLAFEFPQKCWAFEFASSEVEWYWKPSHVDFMISGLCASMVYEFHQWVDRFTEVCFVLSHVDLWLLLYVNFKMLSHISMWISSEGWYWKISRGFYDIRIACFNGMWIPSMYWQFHWSFLVFCDEPC